MERIVMFEFDTRSKLIMTAFAMLALIWAPNLEAQQPPPPQQQQVEVDDEELTTFARAYLAVDEIRVEIEQRMQNAGSPEEAQQVQQEGNARMVEAVEGEGMDPQRYSQIGTTLNQDAELRERFQAILDELTEDPSG